MVSSAPEKGLVEAVVDKIGLWCTREVVDGGCCVRRRVLVHTKRPKKRVWECESVGV